MSGQREEWTVNIHIVQEGQQVLRSQGDSVSTPAQHHESQNEKRREASTGHLALTLLLAKCVHHARIILPEVRRLAAIEETNEWQDLIAPRDSAQCCQHRPP